MDLAEEDSILPKIPKRSQHLAASNQLAPKLNEDAISANTENYEVNESCQTERVISISDELPDAQNDEVKSNAFELRISN